MAMTPHRRRRTEAKCTPAPGPDHVDGAGRQGSTAIVVRAEPSGVKVVTHYEWGQRGRRHAGEYRFDVSHQHVDRVAHGPAAVVEFLVDIGGQRDGHLKPCRQTPVRVVGLHCANGIGHRDAWRAECQRRVRPSGEASACPQDPAAQVFALQPGPPGPGDPFELGRRPLGRRSGSTAGAVLHAANGDDVSRRYGHDLPIAPSNGQVRLGDGFEDSHHVAGVLVTWLLVWSIVRSIVRGTRRPMPHGDSQPDIGGRQRSELRHVPPRGPRVRQPG